MAVLVHTTECGTMLAMPCFCDKEVRKFQIVGGNEEKAAIIARRILDAIDLRYCQAMDN